MLAYLGWTGAVICFVVLESVTVNLVSVWFAVGAAAGLLAAVAGANFTGQLAAFVFVAALSLLATRPLVRKYLSDRPSVATNADRVVGMIGKVRERVDDESGTVYADGKLWTARSSSGVVIPEGAQVTVERIDGVKLIVSPVRETAQL